MKYDFDVVIVGGGSAGLLAAEVAAQMGVKAALVERDRLGGDCLWTGCVPSKALLASAKAAQTIREATRYGLHASLSPVDTGAVWQRLKAIRNEVAETDDNPDRYRGMGVEVIYGEARLAADHVIEAAGRRLTTRFALICTGSRPAVPAISGLADCGYLTSETLFEQDRAPESIVILGGGPIGVEVAQAMARLGVKATLLQRAPRILSRDEPDLAQLLRKKLAAEGVDIRTGVEVTQVQKTPQGVGVTGQTGAGERVWEAEALLVAAGREPNIEALNLEGVGVQIGRRGVRVDSKMRTTVDWIYAAGDCVGRYRFTHSAGSEAVTALRNMFYPGSASAQTPVPWTTFTDPELAHVGMTQQQARRKLGEGKTRVYRRELPRSDRARAEGATDGAIIVVTDDRFHILGAHILAPSAGEMIGQFTLAISKRTNLTPDFANLIQVYPTYSTSIAQTAAEATYGQLQRPFLRTLRKLSALFQR